MVRKIFGLFILVLALGTVGVLYAQQKGGMKMKMGGMMGMMSMMKDCPMMGAMAQGPAAALEHREELGLTDVQIQQLEAIRADAKPTRMQAMKRMKAMHEEIARATEGDQFNEAAVRTAFDRMGDLHTETGMTMLRTRHEVRQVLTSEQREELAGVGVGGGMMRGMSHGESCKENTNSEGIASAATAARSTDEETRGLKERLAYLETRNQPAENWS